MTGPQKPPTKVLLEQRWFQYSFGFLDRELWIFGPRMVGNDATSTRKGVAGVDFRVRSEISLLMVLVVGPLTH